MMNRKIVLIVMVVIFFFLLFSSSKDTEVVNTEDEYDNAYYGENSQNIFIKIGKTTDRILYYCVDVVIMGIGSVFTMILG